MIFAVLSIAGDGGCLLWSGSHSVKDRRGRLCRPDFSTSFSAASFDDSPTPVHSAKKSVSGTRHWTWDDAPPVVGGAGSPGWNSKVK